MAHVTVKEVQSWLEKTKLRIDQDDELVEEEQVAPLVLGRLASRFTVSGWTDATSTPEAVRKVIAMLVAAARYNAAYSETAEDAGNPYALKLEQFAWDLVERMLDGSFVLTDVTLDGPGVEGILSFYPTDASTSIDDETDAGRAFTMGQVF